MNKIKHIVIVTLTALLLLTSIVDVVAQKKAPITGTSLKILLEDGYTIDENSATIYSSEYGMTFMEMEGVSFDDQIGDFDDIEEKYAEKGITVKKNQLGKIGNYKAQLITIDSEPSIYQIFLGDKAFCAFVNIVAVDTKKAIDEKAINSFLSTIEYEDSQLSALEEHANFIIINNKKSDWEFISYTMSTFGFANKKSNDGIMLMQLPLESLTLGSKKALAEEFIGKYKNSMPNLETVEEGNWSTGSLDGYRVILNLAEDTNENLGIIYMFIFSSEKSAFVFQGMGKKNEKITKKLFEDFLKDIELKK